MGGNKTVVYKGPAKVAVEDLDYPELELAEQKRRVDHGVILKAVATNICGSDQHMVRGRTTAPVGQTLGHEITGEGAGTSNTSRSGTWYRSPSTSPAAGAGCVWSAARASA